MAPAEAPDLTLDAALFMGGEIAGDALHDRIARTAVVYSWDARAARLRWLARQESAPTA